MKYRRMPIEIESPEQMGYGNIACNLAESSVTDARLGDFSFDLSNLVLAYGHHVGSPKLCELIAQESPELSADDVLLTAGAAGALFIVNSALLEKGDHIIVARPNYSTNIETPRLIGCEIDFLELKLEENFRLDIKQLKKLIKPETKLISLTTPHNPTGAMISEEELRELARIAEENNISVLIDETYRELSFAEKTPIAASLSPNVISISSVSKAYGLPGVRIGWIINTDKNLMEQFLAAKEEIYICNSLVDEEIAYLAMKDKEKILGRIKTHVAENFEILKAWLLGQDYLDYVLPDGGAVCFPRIKDDKNVDIEKFYRILNDIYKTHVGPGHWFDMDKRYMRIGFGWPKKEELIAGLENMAKALKESMM